MNQSPSAAVHIQHYSLSISIMASRSFSRTLRSSLTHQLTSPASQRRTLISASKYGRKGLAAPLKPAFAASLQQTRGLKTIDFAGTKEVVYGDSLPWQFRASCKILTGMQSARIGREKSCRYEPFWHHF